MTITMRIFCAAIFLLAGASRAEAGARSEPCHDVIVKARIAAQVPSAVPDDCGPNCIIMVWPWFLDLDVSRMLVGDVPRGRLQVLAMLHVGFAENNGTRRWLLRRNTLGGYNLLRLDDERRSKPCARDAEPAMAYIVPGPGRTLADFRVEGERAYHIHE